jgi:hypothetical protein
MPPATVTNLSNGMQATTTTTVSPNGKTRAWSRTTGSVSAITTIEGGKSVTATTLDQALAEAMDKNPGIIAAKAKVALAQAELSSRQLEVARQLVALWSDRQIQENAVKSARNQLERVEQLNRTTPGAISAEVLDNAKSALIDTEAKSSRTQTELRYLTGLVNLMARDRALDIANARSATVQSPREPIVEKIRQALDEKISVDFDLSPISEVITQLRKSTKIPIVHDAAFPVEWDIRLKLDGATLGAVLQAIEDQNRDVRFVVRDYGLFLTDRAYAAEEGFLPLAEFVKAKTGNNAGPAAPSKASSPASHPRNDTGF